LKSAAIGCPANETKPLFAGKLVNWSVVGAETPKNRTFDVPPPGVGFETVTEAVAAVAIFEAGTAAVTCELLTKVVVRGVPFQFTNDPETNPTPFTFSMKLGPPGAVTVGTSGSLIKGTGFPCPSVIALASNTNGQTSRMDFVAVLRHKCPLSQTEKSTG